MTQQIDAALETKGFEPSRYLRKLGGKDYLEVKWRLLWLRNEHPEALIVTELIRLEGDFALFKATVSIPDGGTATGFGSETKADFFDFIEKAETKALGRALAALGYGTQFCDDHDFAAGSAGNAHAVDSPVERPSGNGQTTPPPQSASNLATPAQLKLIYLTAERDLQITQEELEERCNAQYGRLPLHLTKREASEFIDGLKSGQIPPALHQAPAAAMQQPAPQPTGQEDVQVWVSRWLEQVGGQDAPKLGKRSEELKWMAAHLEGSGIPRERVALMCKTLHEAFTGDTLAEGVLVGEVMDARLILALKGADNAALMMLSRFAKGL